MDVLRVAEKLGVATTAKIHRALAADNVKVSRARVANLVSTLVGRGLLTAVGDYRPQEYKPTKSTRKTFNSLVRAIATRLLGKEAAATYQHLVDPKDSMTAAEHRRLMEKIKAHDAGEK